jgi:biopolymer transport protein ExbD
MGAKLGGGGQMAEINMTPLIDIVLVVLIIMMVNIPIQVEQLGVKLPSNEPPPPQTEPNPDQLVVMLYEDGRVALNKMLMDDETLFAEMTRRLRPMSKKMVFIDAFPTTRFEKVMDYVDMAKEAGAEKVSFAKLKETGPASPTGAWAGALPRGILPGSPGVVGAMTEKQADEQFRPMLAQIETCYAAALAANPVFEGHVIFGVDVGPQGEVMAATVVTRTVEDAAFEQCVLQKIPALRYEPLGPEKTARVHYPILLSKG